MCNRWWDNVSIEMVSGVNVRDLSDAEWGGVGECGGVRGRAGESGGVRRGGAGECGGVRGSAGE